MLIDVDSIWANLALMKLSTYHKQLGTEVYLNRINPKYWKNIGNPVSLKIDCPLKHFDKVYISCIFTKNRSRAFSVKSMFESMGMKVKIGGSGISLESKLPEEVEHLMPNYELYGLDYSVGFLTRGCIRNCPWCIVPKKEGEIRFNAPLKEFLHPRHRKVILLDNNLLAYLGHKELLMELIGLEVCFNQGFDIRLIDDENANLLRIIKHRDTEFKTPRLYFSWDLLNIEDAVLKGIEVLKNHGIPPSRLFFYILCGFGVKKEDYTWSYFLENDWYRYETLSKLGAKPFIMKYNGRRDIPLLNAFSRWVNFMYKAKKKELGMLRSFKTFLEYEYLLKPWW